MPPLQSSRHDAAAIASYLLYKAPAAHRVRVPLSAARANQLVGHLEAHRHETDCQAVVDVVSALAEHAPREAVEELMDQLARMVRLGKGLVMG